MKTLRIITAVERTPVENLIGMVRVSKTSVRIPDGISWLPIKIKPHAQLSVTDKIEDNNKVWAAKLVFKTFEDLVDVDRFAYRCRLLDGRYRLVGAPERPYPVASVIENMPELVTDNQLNEVTVSWQSPHFIPLIEEF
jgi:hypothetical protein